MYTLQYLAVVGLQESFLSCIKNCPTTLADTGMGGPGGHSHPIGQKWDWSWLREALSFGHGAGYHLNL